MSKVIVIFIIMFSSFAIQAKKKSYKVNSIEVSRTEDILVNFIIAVDCEGYLGTTYFVKDKKLVNEIMSYVISMQPSKDDVISRDTRARLTIRYKNCKRVDVVCLGINEVFLNGVKMSCCQELLYLVFRTAPITRTPR